MLKNILLTGGRVTVGLAAKKFLELVFDYGVYPAALVWLGYLWGGLIMTCAAVVLNILIIKAYDWAETDWLFIEKLKHIRENDTVELPRVLRWFKPILTKGDILAFFVLCLDDPVTATLYLRKGAYQYNGLSSRDWKIFAAANVVANLYWIIGLAGVIETVKSVRYALL